MKNLRRFCSHSESLLQLAFSARTTFDDHDFMISVLVRLLVVSFATVFLELELEASKPRKCAEGTRDTVEDVEGQL